MSYSASTRSICWFSQSLLGGPVFHQLPSLQLGMGQSGANKMKSVVVDVCAPHMLNVGTAVPSSP